MALYAHRQDIGDFESDWYPTVLLAPVNGKLYIGARELSKDDRWHQEDYGRRGKKKWRSQEDANRVLNPGTTRKKRKPYP